MKINDINKHLMRFQCKTPCMRKVHVIVNTKIPHCGFQHIEQLISSADQHCHVSSSSIVKERTYIVHPAQFI